MGFAKKYTWEIIAATTIFLVFIFTRFYNILSLPIFTDEAIYVRWAQIAKNDAAWRFMSLTDGKQPLFMWLEMVLMRFIKDPLLAGRMVSVGAGLFSMIGLFFLGKELFKNRWIGFLSSFFYLIFPFALVYDKMALYDSLVGTFSVWGLYFEILLVRRLRLDVALILAMIIGGGVLNKTSGFFNLYLLPFSLVLFDFGNQRLKRLFKWAGLALIVVVLSNLYYSVLRLSPFFHIINEKNALFVYPFQEWLKHPFEFFGSNLFVGQWNWLYTYLTFPILLIVLLSFFVNKEFLKEKILLLVWFLVPFFALALFGRVLYPRFIFFMTLSLLPLAAFTIWSWSKIITNKYLFITLCLLVSFFMLRSDYLILNDFTHAPIPDSDVNQYNNAWPAGGGIKESVEFFKEKAKKEKIYVATQGTFGLLPYGLEIYLGENPNIKIQGFWPIEEKPPREVIEVSKKMPTYFVFYQMCSLCPKKGKVPSSWVADPVLEFKKGEVNTYLTVYQIHPK